MTNESILFIVAAFPAAHTAVTVCAFVLCTCQRAMVRSMTWRRATHHAITLHRHAWGKAGRRRHMFACMCPMMKWSCAATGSKGHRFPYQSARTDRGMKQESKENCRCRFIECEPIRVAAVEATKRCNDPDAPDSQVNGVACMRPMGSSKLDTCSSGASVNLRDFGACGNRCP